MRLKSAALLFGGTAQKTSSDVTIALTCPVTQNPITSTISVPEDQQFDKVVLWPYAESRAGDELAEAPPIGVAPAEAQTAATPADPVADEYVEWVKASRSTALEFGKNMLTTSSAAVAVYFAVLKYLGFKTAPHSAGTWVSIVPPALFTCATLVFAMALRPALARVNPQSFQDWRDRRLGQMNARLTAGTALLVLGLAVAVWVYLDLTVLR